LTAAALVALAAACAGNETLSWRLLLHGPEEISSARADTFSFLRNSWFLGGLAAGCGTMVRPETPLVLITLGGVLLWRWRRRADWPKLMRAGALTAIGFVIPLIPWTARNAISLHEFQPLAPRYAQSPDETVPTGFYAWTNTWLERYRDVDPIIWKVGGDQVNMASFPPAAFDTQDERERVSNLVNQYDKACCGIPPEWDAQFAELARERTARHPLRTYFNVPFQRALTLWFTPRVEILGYAGDLWPMKESYDSDHADFLVTLSLAIVAIIYVGIAFAGSARIFVKHFAAGPQVWAVALLIAFCVVRTAFFTRVETPEPRYVLECFPVVFALGAFLWTRNSQPLAPPHQ